MPQDMWQEYKVKEKKRRQEYMAFFEGVKTWMGLGASTLEAMHLERMMERNCPNYIK